ncbi:MAG: carbon-nitrogen hydrolase family protein [Candidatus Latescibacterota bacterium]
MKISVIQSKSKFRYDPDDPGAYDLALCCKLAQPGIEEGFQMVEQAAREGAHLIVTVEGFNGTVSYRDRRYHFPDVSEPLDGPLIRRFSDLAGQYGIYIVGGLYTSRDGNAYNSAVLFGPEGSIVGIYDKVHLPAGEEIGITPGDFYPTFETEHGLIGLLVCWDMQYPEAPRELALSGVDLIACPTLGWENIYGLSRAYENGVSIAAAMGLPSHQDLWDFCDPSCVVDNMGRIVSAGGRRSSEIVTAELDIRREPAPQYGAGEITGMNSMRRIRMMQRRPDTYRLVSDSTPPVLSRYADTAG